MAISPWSAAVRRHTTTTLVSSSAVARQNPLLSRQWLPARSNCLAFQTPSAIPSSSFSGVRFASIVPYSVNEHAHYSPPPPPMTLEQVLQRQQQKQQSLLEEQVQLEQQQRLRQQRELQVELAKHRNAIVEQQRQRLLEEEQQQQQLQKQHQQTHEQQAKHDPSTLSNERRQNHQDKSQDTPIATQSDQEDSTAAAPHQYHVPLHRRTMFGYRGPEQQQRTASSAPSSASLLTTDMKGKEAQIKQPTVHVHRIPFMITAENRVRLAMLDYTPKQIDAMTPAQAHAILYPVVPVVEAKGQDESEACANSHTKDSALEVDSLASNSGASTDRQYHHRPFHVASEVMAAASPSYHVSASAVSTSSSPSSSPSKSSSRRHSRSSSP